MNVARGLWSSYVLFSLSWFRQGYGGSQRNGEGRDAGFPQIEEGGQGFSRALPGRVRTCGADALDVVALDAAYVIRCLRL